MHVPRNPMHAAPKMAIGDIDDFNGSFDGEQRDTCERPDGLAADQNV